MEENGEERKEKLPMGGSPSKRTSPSLMLYGMLNENVPSFFFLLKCRKIIFFFDINRVLSETTR